MNKGILLLCLLTPMAHAIGVATQYTDLKKTYYDADGTFKYRITVAQYHEDYTKVATANVFNLMSIHRLQSESISLGKGIFETPSASIHFERGTYSCGDIVLFAAHGCIPTHCFSSREARIRRTDLRLTAQRAMLFDGDGKPFAHKRHYQLSLH